MQVHKSDLVPLKPQVFNAFNCPQCGKPSPEANSIYFPGIHVTGQYNCASCNCAFERDLPIGFANDHPLAVGLGDKRFFNSTSAPEWLTEPFIHHYNERSEDAVRIDRKVYKECKDVVVLNCLDFLYGHVLLKLYNAQHYLDEHPDKGLIIIAPRMYSWMIPVGIAEHWEVHLGLGKLRTWHNDIDRTIQPWLANYNKVWLGRGYSHPEFHKIDISRFIDVPSFPVNEFVSRPLHITFVARRDRLWFRNPLAKFVYRVLNKLGLKKSLGNYFIGSQNRMIKRTMRKIKSEVPNAQFSVVGLAKPTFAPEVANDLRTMNMNPNVEMDWCKVYGKSQLIVGVHGSNMLLPTAFAAGCIEILPHDRNGNIVQDISVRYADRMQMFMYRFVDEFASPKAIARTAVAMYKDYPVFNNNNRVNIF